MLKLCGCCFCCCCLLYILCASSLAGEYQESLRVGISTALVRLRDYDLDTKEGLSQELQQAAEFLDQAARLAMAAMLQVCRPGVEGKGQQRKDVQSHFSRWAVCLQSVHALMAVAAPADCYSFSTAHLLWLCPLQGPVFDTDAKRAQGPVLRWVDRLLKAPPLGISYGALPAVPKADVGRTALLSLLRSNLEMFSVYVDRCYDRDARIATASFQVRRKRGLHLCCLVARRAGSVCFAGLHAYSLMHCCQTLLLCVCCIALPATTGCE